MKRQTMFSVSPLEVVGLTLSRYKLSQGWKVTNVGDDPAELLILTGTPAAVNLQPGESWESGGIAGIFEMSETFTLQNTSPTESSQIQFEMRDRRLPLTLIDAGDRQDLSLGRIGVPISDDLDIYVEGEDSECDNTVVVSINAGPPATTSVGPPQHDSCPQSQGLSAATRIPPPQEPRFSSSSCDPPTFNSRSSTSRGGACAR